MQNAGLDEAQAEIKIAGKNINKLRHHTYGRKQRGTKEPLNEVKEESEKVGLKLNIQKAKIMEFSPITSWQIYGETVETVTEYFLELQHHHRW